MPTFDGDDMAPPLASDASLRVGRLLACGLIRSRGFACPDGSVRTISLATQGSPRSEPIDAGAHDRVRVDAIVGPEAVWTIGPDETRGAGLRPN